MDGIRADLEAHYQVALLGARLACLQHLQADLPGNQSVHLPSPHEAALYLLPVYMHVLNTVHCPVVCSGKQETRTLLKLPACFFACCRCS